jgi:hypothetical protein
MDKNLNNIDEIFAKALGDHSIDPPPHVWENIQGQLEATSGQEIDQVFSKTLGEHTMTPPAYVWDNIKDKLDADSGKRRVRFGWIMGSACAIIFSFVGGYIIANYSGFTNNDDVSEKITNTHKTQIDVNHFWELHGISTVGQSNSGGHTYTTTTQGTTIDINDGSGLEDNRVAPTNNSGEHTPIVPSINQSGGDDNGKKNNAVTIDVNGKVESQMGTNGSTNVTALNDNTVITTNSTKNDVVNNNNDTKTNVDENRYEVVNPNDESTYDDKLDENGNPVVVKFDNPVTFTILPYFSPTVTWRNSSMLSSNGIQNAFDTTNGNSKFSERMNFSYSAGLLVGYNFTPNLTVFIGASYNTFSNTTSRNDIHTRSFDQIPAGDTSTNIFTTAGELNSVNVVPTSTGSPEDPTYMLQDNMVGKVKSITQTFSYIEVPVLLRYRIGGPKIGLILTGGISTGFIVQNAVTVEGANETKTFGETSQIRNFNMNASFGVGIEAKILPFMYLNIEPTFKYSFLNWSMDSRFQMNPISLGLNTGVAFKF